MKRILVIVGILVAAVAIVTIGVLLRGGSAPAGPSSPLPPGGTLPIVGTNGVAPGNNPGTTGGNFGNGSSGTGGNLPISGVGLVAQTAIIDYAIGPQGVTFIAPNGAVILASDSSTVGQADFGNILGAWFSPDGKWLLVKSGDTNLPSWNLLDIAKKTWRNIQTNTTEMVWSPNSSQLAYFAERANSAGLTTYTTATGATRTLLSMYAPDLRLKWKDSSRIFIMDRPSSLVSGNIWDFNVANGTLTPFATNISGAELLWGGERSGGLLFRAGSTGGTLSIVNSSGSTAQNTSFLTLPSKCAFGESAPTSTVAGIARYLFCAIPQDQAMMKESQLPDNYLRGEFGTNDTLYAIGLISGSFTEVLPAAQNLGFSVENVKIYGDSVYFVNRNDSRLYKVSLEGFASATADERGEG